MVRMSSLSSDEWELFLRRMISHNLGLFEKAGGEGDRGQRLEKRTAKKITIILL
jgi:hypothetical protein